LLENTLSGAVKTLTDLLAMANPVAGRQTARINRYVETTMTALEVDHWEIRLASLLSQIGTVNMPTSTMDKIYADKPLSDEEQQLFAAHYEVAGSLVRAIPRLETVAAIIECQSDTGFMDEMAGSVEQWDVGRLGSVLTRLAIELDAAVTRGTKMPVAIDSILKNYSALPEPLKRAFQALAKSKGQSMEPVMMGIKGLTVGMVLDEDLIGANGVCLCSSGQEISRTLVKRLQAISERVGIKEPFRVLAPM